MYRFIFLSLLLLSGCAGESEPGTASPAPAVAASDYLTTDLRASVEALKSQVTDTPAVSTTQELNQRAQLLYAWANAMALKGDDIPWSLPQMVANIARQDNLPRGEVIAPAQLANLNAAVTDYVEQLRLRDENPAALGKVTAVNPGPHPVMSWQTIVVKYEVGTEGIKQGGALSLGTHGASGLLLQGDDPAGEDYATATVSREGVSIVPAKVVGSGRRRALSFDVVGGDLQPGDVVTFLYGDTSAGGPGARMQATSNDFIPMELFVQLVPGGTEYTLPRFGFKTEGGPVAGVRGFAPSIVDINETFTISVRSEDVYTNRATGAIPGYRLMLNGAVFREIAPGNVITLAQASFATPGVYRFALESEDGSIKGEVNPILVEKDPAQRIYWGETHGHSGMAEGQGTSDAFFEFGRDDARLDFLVHSEHDIWMDDAEWRELEMNTREFMAEGEFIPFLGYEWTVEQAYGGHHNVVFRTPDNRTRVPQQTHTTLSMLYQGLRENHDPEDVLIIPHAHQAGDWRNSDPTMETLVEIQSNHGVFEWFGHMYLRHGHHVGFVAASDDHTAHPGYGVSRGRRSGLAAVMAPEKTSGALFDAMKTLATYASTGDRPIVRFQVNGTEMGGRASFAGKRTVSAQIHGASRLDELVVLKNSEEIWRKDLRTLPQSNPGRQTIELQLESSSQPLMDQRDLPRGARVWNGTIEVRNGTLANIDAPGFIDVLTQGYEIDESNPNLVRFRTWTRGNRSSLMLNLENASANTEIRVTINPGRETQNSYARYRGVVQLPRWAANFKLGGMKEGVLSQTQDVEGHEDILKIRRVKRDAPMDYSFDFVDESKRQDDYYTLRVIQENGQMAWSSPVWVGGYSVR